MQSLHAARSYDYIIHCDVITRLSSIQCTRQLVYCIVKLHLFFSPDSRHSHPLKTKYGFHFSSNYGNNLIQNHLPEMFLSKPALARVTDVDTGSDLPSPCCCNLPRYQRQLRRLNDQALIARCNQLLPSHPLHHPTIA